MVMIRSCSGLTVMVDVPRWRPPRGACPSCGRDTALRRDASVGAYFPRDHNNPETGRLCRNRWPVRSESVRLP